MRGRKLFAGARIRALRQSHQLTQAVFAERIGISTSYLNQIENNQRPVTASILLALADTFQLDVTSLAADESDRMVVDLREILADPMFKEDPPGLQELKIAAANAPAFVKAFLSLHRTYQQSNERLAGLDSALVDREGPLPPLPYEEVRDFFHYQGNYVDALDRAAETFADRVGLHDRTKLRVLISYLEDRHGVRVIFGGEASASEAIRVFDQTTRILSLNPASPESTHFFQLAHQVAFLEQAETMESLLDAAKFKTQDSREVCRIGLANFFAGAVQFPYIRFLNASKQCRHDLDVLSNQFLASCEQVAHRLSTMQRAGAKGVPFFFVRVDQAGNITKRHSATRLQFARFGGACPLWNVHRAFETPNRLIRQLAETPDGVRYICLARDVTKQSGGFAQPIRRYAIALGCEVAYAGDLVYADDLDITKDAAFEPIGISCRICEREACHQRAVPPVERQIKVDHQRRNVVPFSIA